MSSELDLGFAGERDWVESWGFCQCFGVEEEWKAFCADPKRTSSVLPVFCAREWKDEGRGQAGTSVVLRKGMRGRGQAGMSVVLRLGAAQLLVRDALRRPLAQLELGEVDAGLQRRGSSVMQAHLGVRICAWTYNAVITAWEPCLVGEG